MHYIHMHYLPTLGRPAVLNLVSPHVSTHVTKNTNWTLVYRRIRSHVLSQEQMT